MYDDGDMTGLDEALGAIIGGKPIGDQVVALLCRIDYLSTKSQGQDAAIPVILGAANVLSNLAVAEAIEKVGLDSSGAGLASNVADLFSPLSSMAQR